ncbi:hypothetical protein [Lactiplantibacillus plantarum]|uniref:hypothetical protein n=1 Tax=Lactiplantibacillus plantarum TaxID=1590 RepID=UPI000CD36A34|nr:hypothetical protein [Lactiplantibacillus plantarum]AUV71129.1 hypothetical protein C1940_00965 [Lactiplantibacillus plantarum subsp. plantarum]AWY48555.1 hypothetical protein CFN49_10040 [Lactiplantibacillus plantarum]MCG0717264.1 hypothetical protein [Lactiplantibacillus plantarum]MCG0836980.1 hypothetical protein [Lactiplantibacillus plantarum]MZV26129.1 hypothetical protein [Lactiplantibacillus plantarum]
MNKIERQANFESQLASNELMYDKKLHVKRVPGNGELFELSRSLESSSREILSNLTGSFGQHTLASLLKTKTLNQQRVFGIGGTRVFNAFYTNKVNSELLTNWLVLSRAAWFLREKGVRLGQFSRIKATNDLETVASMDGQTLAKLQFKVIDDDQTTPIVMEPGHTLVALFKSFESMVIAINQQRDRYSKQLLDGCLMLCLRQVEDFQTIQGYSLNVIKKDDRNVINPVGIDNSESVRKIQFKQSTKPVDDIISQLNWQYDEALSRKMKTVKSNGK